MHREQYENTFLKDFMIDELKAIELLRRVINIKRKLIRPI